MQLWPSSFPDIYVAEFLVSEVDRNVKMQHGSVTDEVTSPSAGVGCMLQDVRNQRSIFKIT